MSGPFEDLEQGTEEWLEARLGKATSSRLSDIMTRTKSGYGAGRKNYTAELICERMTGNGNEHFVSKEMAWGTETEPVARTEYEIATGSTVREVGFVQHPTIEMSGGSPDGLVGEDGIIEIKCPNTATHIATILSGSADSKYIKQMQWNMECTGRRWCDFVSYDPRMPEGLQLFISRVDRDDEFLKEAREEVVSFLAELDEMIEKLRAVGKKEIGLPA